MADASPASERRHLRRQQLSEEKRILTKGLQRSRSCTQVDTTRKSEAKIEKMNR